MPAELFDMKLRAMRRDRAARTGTELFLYERAFADCIDRLGVIGRRVREALLIGCPDPAWPGRLGEFADRVDVIDPGRGFAEAARGTQAVEDEFIPSQSYGLCLALGTLDTVNDLPQALVRIRYALEYDGVLLGAIAGGQTLPVLRSAMRAADLVADVAIPHVHPRIEPGALASLLATAGFVNPVVDVDRVQVSYTSLDRLLLDLRGMAATNILTERARRPLPRAAWAAARSAFAAAGNDGRTTEAFEILHFAAWNPASGLSPR
jgi:hypothetical protein